MRLLVRAIHLVVDWFAGTVMTTTIWIGVIVIAIGLVTWFVAGFMSPVDRETGRQRRQGHAARKQARTKDASPESASTQNTSRRTTPVTRGRTADAPKTPADTPVPTSPSSSSKPASSSNKAAPKISAAEKDEDAELEAILRKRGIE